jgi:phage shock protein PspC (stress-responsive transcriptional regulator)
MKRAISANIAGILFTLDEDAYRQIEQYLRTIESGYNYSAEGKEIVTDLETRLAELLEGKTLKREKIVTTEDVTWAISILGKPEEIGHPQFTSETIHHSPYYKPIHRLYRDPDNKVIGGVCGGLGAYFDVDPVILRVVFVLLLFLGFGPLLYIIMWIALPKALTVTQKLEMYGIPPTPENIRKFS